VCGGEAVRERARARDSEREREGERERERGKATERERERLHTEFTTACRESERGCERESEKGGGVRGREQAHVHMCIREIAGQREGARARARVRVHERASERASELERKDAPCLYVGHSRRDQRAARDPYLVYVCIHD